MLSYFGYFKCDDSNAANQPPHTSPTTPQEGAVTHEQTELQVVGVWMITKEMKK